MPQKNGDTMNCRVLSANSTKNLILQYLVVKGEVMDKNKISKVKEEMLRLNDAIVAMERYWGPKETGAVRRASMDLTRALAELRKP